MLPCCHAAVVPQGCISLKPKGQGKDSIVMTSKYIPRVLLYATTLIALLLLVVDILSAIILYGFPKSSYGRAKYRLGLDTLSDIVVFLAFIWLCLQIQFLHKSPKKMGRVLDIASATTIRPLSVVIVVLNFIILIANIFMFLNVKYLQWLSSTSDQHGAAIALKCLHSVELGLSVIFITALVILVSWPFTMLADCLIVVSSVLQAAITLTTVLINFSAVYLSGVNSTPSRQEQAVVCMCLLLAGVGVLGFATVHVVRAHNRLSVQSRLLIHYYIILCTVSAALCFAWFVYDVNSASSLKDSIFKEVRIANCMLAAAGLGLDICCIFCARRLLAVPSTKLKVQPYDLTQLSPLELQQLAKVIDLHNSKSSPDIPTGEHVLELMSAYVAAPMNNFSCKVLRVYDDSTKPVDEREYNCIKSWDMPESKSIFEETISLTTFPNVPPKLSKNALKKAQRKAAKKGVILEQSEDGLGKAFSDELAATEAIVLLTTIHSYDITSTVGNKTVRNLLNWVVGEKSTLKMMCIRLGILGTHWPFRQMIYYTAPTKKPMARSAAILTAITEWNLTLPRSERCTIMYNPSYKNNVNEEALKLSGWVTTSLLPSHVIDLRPFNGKSLDEYLKSKKYRNQGMPFKSAGGEVIETAEFSQDNCDLAIDLWSNIALKRTSQGHTAVLKYPEEQFLANLGSRVNNQCQWRKLLLLKVDGEVVASCILFDLGNTLTSDIQGLDHALGRKYKAYFVMMQETIRIALRDGKSFVDFGPTTSKPKIDIGCSGIPLLGGVWCKQPLKGCVGIFANEVSG